MTLSLEKPSAEATLEPTARGLLPLIGRDEMNLAEFALGLASDRNPKNLKTVERSQTLKLANGKVLEQHWVVTGSEKYGLPRGGDDDLLLGLLKIASDANFSDRRVQFSRYELLQVLDWPLNGQSYQRIEDGLNRLVGVRIYAKNAFWDNERKSYLSMNFGIVDEFQIYENRHQRANQGQTEIPLTYVVFSDKLYNSIKSNNIKRLDLNFYYALGSTITKRLYRFLDKRRWGKTRLVVDILTLATMNLGLDTSGRSYASQVKQRLDSSHQELVDKGFLSGWEYRLGKDRKSWLVEYSFGSEAPALPSGETASPGASLLEQLMLRGLSRAVGQRLIDGFPERIAEKLEIYDHLVRTRSRMISKNPQGWLRRAIEEDYQAQPADFESSQEREQKKQAKAARERAQKEKREAEEYNHERLWQAYERLDAFEKDKLLAEVRERIRFLPAAKRQELDSDHPIVRAEILTLMEERLS